MGKNTLRFVVFFYLFFFVWSASGQVILQRKAGPDKFQKGETTTLVIEAICGEIEINGMQVNLAFHPADYEILDVQVNPVFNVVLDQTIDNENGMINYAAGILASSPPSGTFDFLTMTVLMEGASCDAGMDFQYGPFGTNATSPGNGAVLDTAIDFSLEIVGTRIHIDTQASGGPCGYAWTGAYPDIQSGLVKAYAEQIDTIWVAQGTYYTTLDDDRSKSFTLQGQMKWYGGFNGNENALSERNPVENPTVMSGEIGNPADPSDNAYHVLVVDGSCSGCVLDGFDIQSGTATGPQPADQAGGGIYVQGSLQMNQVSVAECIGIGPAAVFLDGTNAQLSIGGLNYIMY